MGYGAMSMYSDHIPYKSTNTSSSSSISSESTNSFKITMCPLSKRKLQLCAFMIRGGKQITPIRFCGHASPNLHHLKYLNDSRCKPSTRHAEIGTINCLKEKQRQLRLLKKTTLIVIRFSQRNIIIRDNENNEENSFELYLSNSKPCKQCIKILKILQLKSVIYVDQNGQLIKKKPRNINDCVDSGGTLFI